MDFKKVGLVALVTLIFLATTVFALAPVTAIDGNFTNAWKSADANIGLTCTPSDSNTCLLTQYRVDSGAWQTYTERFFITTDGNHKIDFNSIAGYSGGTLTDANAKVETTKTVYTLIDKTAPTVGATSFSGFSNVGSNYYGTGTIVGGTAVDTNTGLKNGYSDLNTSSCEYTVDGTTWLPATWSSNHCQKTSVTINGGHSYNFATRIRDNVANQGAGATKSVQGAMLVTDLGTVTIDTVAQMIWGIASNTANLVLVLILGVVVVVIVDAVTGIFGIFSLLKKYF